MVTLLSKTNLKYINTYNKSKKSTLILTTDHFSEASASDDVNKAIIFNKFLYTLFFTGNFMSPENDVNVDTSVRQYLISINISEEDVLEALKCLDPEKFFGIDTISPRVLRNVFTL